MRKSLELSDPNSCLHKARADELLFVLLERDAAAPDTIREWIRKRIELGLNVSTDDKIVEARQWIAQVEQALGVTAVTDDAYGEWMTNIENPHLATSHPSFTDTFATRHEYIAWVSKFLMGPPKPSHHFSEAQLRDVGIVGLYKPQMRSE